MNNFKQLILIPLLIISLMALNLLSLSFLALAEEGEGESQSTEEPPVEEPPAEEPPAEEPPAEEPPVEEPPIEETTAEETGSQEELNTTEETNSTETTKEDTATIETGDAVGVVDVENEVNTNVTDLGDTEESTEGEEATQEEPSDDQSTDQSSGEEESTEATEEGCSEPDTCQPDDEVSVEIDNESEATIDNDLDGEAATGENSASNNNGDSTIETGDAVAVSNLSNVANTNVVGSNFWFYLFNIFYNLIGDVHFNNFSTNQTDNCGLIDCVDPLTVSNNSVGTIVNDIELYALTGLNTADDNAGDATINTGNALALANVSNLLNTNIVGSDWLFGILNSFGNWQGNLVLPGAQAINDIVNGGDAAGDSIYVENNSDATVEDNVNVEATTGDNTASDNVGGSEINTGDAYASASISTRANTNIFGSNWLLVGVKVLGNWEGTVWGIPEGISWLRTPDGLILFNDTWADAINGSSEDNDGASLEVSNNSIGTIINNLNVVASTGDNSASNNEGSGSINTGDAVASANIANFVNTNIIGRNWLFAMFNIFGDWQGNLAFGQPDLWIGESAVTSPDPAEPGGLITYTLSYTNNGDAEATQVTINDDFDEDYLTVVDTGSGVTNTPGQIEWDIGSVPVGQSGSVSYSVAISSRMPFGSTHINNTSLIDSLEDDANGEDNSDTLSVVVSIAAHSTPVYVSLRDYYRSSNKLPILKITKSNDAEEPVHSNELINYKIVLSNEGGGSAYNVVVTDNFSYATSTEALKTNSWELGEVFPDEEIIIDYSLVINGDALAGPYTNTAQANGLDTLNYPVSSNQATSTVELLVEEKEEVLPEESIEPASLEEVIEEQVEKIVEQISSSMLGIDEVKAAEIDEPYKGVIGAVAKEEPKSFNKKLLASIVSLFQNGSLAYISLCLLGLIILAALVLFYLKHRNHRIE